jgi:hypothetical protein
MTNSTNDGQPWLGISATEHRAEPLILEPAIVAAFTLFWQGGEVSGKTINVRLIACLKSKGF